MRILPVNNYQNQQNQTNFKERVFSTEMGAYAGELLSHVCISPAPNHGHDAHYIRLFLLGKEEPKDAIVSVIKHSKEMAKKAKAILSQALHDAKYTTGEMIDWEKLAVSLKEDGYEL